MVSGRTTCAMKPGDTFNTASRVPRVFQRAQTPLSRRNSATTRIRRSKWHEMLTCFDFERGLSAAERQAGNAAETQGRLNAAARRGCSTSSTSCASNCKPEPQRSKAVDGSPLRWMRAAGFSSRPSWRALAWYFSCPDKCPCAGGDALPAKSGRSAAKAASSTVLNASGYVTARAALRDRFLQAHRTVSPKY